jgi:hypothetical protein
MRRRALGGRSGALPEVARRLTGAFCFTTTAAAKQPPFRHELERMARGLEQKIALLRRVNGEARYAHVR